MSASDSTLAAIAYAAYAQVQVLPQPLYKALSFEERLGWAIGVHAAVVTVIDPEALGRDPPLLEVIATLRQELAALIQRQGWSMNQCGQRSGVDRQTLTRWLRGDENPAVHTLLALEGWLMRERAALGD